MGVKSAAPNSRIFLDSYDLSGFVNSAQFDMTQQTLDARTFNSDGPRNMIGNYDHQHKMTALFDGGTSMSDDTLWGLVSSNADHYLAEMWGANAVGSPVYESIVKLSQTPHKGANGQLQVLDAAFIGNGPVSRGSVLANTTATATGTFANQDGTIASATAITTAQEYQAVFRLLNGTSNSSISVTLDIEECSASGGVYATMPGMSVTFTQQGVSRLSSTAGSKRFKRARISALNLSTGTTGVYVVVTGGLVTS